MRSRLRFFFAVGFLATVIDVGIFWVLKDIGLILANAIALIAAAIFSYFFNRGITFKKFKSARWVSQPHLFAYVALIAGVIDTFILLMSDQLLPLFFAKIIAVVSSAVIRWIAYRQVLFGKVRKILNSKNNRKPSSGKYRLSVVIPAYNEQGRIGGTVKDITEAFTASEITDYEIVVVDDGSTDGTAQEAGDAGATVVIQDPNQGKGAAVRAGFAKSQGRSVVFTDADRAYPPSMILVVLEMIESGWDMVAGSRRHRSTHTSVEAKKIRQIGGWVINRLTYLVLLGQFRDTQCGIKGFHGDVGRVVFERARVDGFAFDVELFLMAEQDGLSVKEIPVFVENRAESSISLVRDTTILFRDLYQMRRWVGRGVYDPTDEQAKVLSQGL